jgi:hypothetical protein
MPAEDPETIYLNKYMKVEWRYKYCSHSYATNGGNHAIKKHLLTKHGKTEKSSRENIIVKSQRSIEHLELPENQSFKRRKLKPSWSQRRYLFDTRQMENSILWAVRRNIS